MESGFKYDAESGKVLDQLKKTAQFEGYYEEAKPEFEALEKKLKHNLATDLERNKVLIKQLLAADIVAHYYYQAGAIENNMKYDKQVKEACRLLGSREEYQSLLAPNTKAERDGKKK